MIDINELTIKTAYEGLKKKDFSAKDLTEVYLHNAKEENKKINAYLEIFDDVKEQAKEADKKIKEGKQNILTGIPIAIKDNILIKGRNVSAASKILEGYKATYDATVISKLKEKGVVFLGRTNMDEFAMGSSTENSAFGDTKNPHDTKRVPGGSSGGSAAAVAMGGALGALGSDTAGSIRQPSSFCGLVGLKPTYGSVSRNGLIALGSSFDVIGPIAKTVGDVEIIFNTIKGKDPMDSTSVSDDMYSKKSIKRKPIIGLLDVRDVFGLSGDKKLAPSIEEKINSTGKATIESNEAFYKSVERLKSLGYKTKKISLPNIKYAVPTYYVILPAEASTNLARFDGVRYGLHVEGKNGIDDYFKTKGAGFGSEVKRRIMVGTYVLSAGYHDAYYNKALSIRNLIREDFEKAFKEVDVIVTPTTTGSAFKLGEKVNDPVKMYLEDLLTVPANHAGIPALTVPSNRGEEGELPLGLQILAPHMQEDILFTIGKDFLDEKR